MGVMHEYSTYHYSKENKHRILAWLCLVLLLLTIVSISFLGITSATPRQRQNSPPVAVIDSPGNADIYAMNEVVHFDASGSSDPDNDPLTYQWNFGDGETGEGVTTSHAYATPWVPIITLTVSDGDTDDTARVVIIIGTGGGQNRPPRASIDSPNNFDTFSIGEIIIFDGSSSSDLDEGDTLSYQWDFGDGNVSSGPITSHAYSELKPYRVKLTVSDGVFNDSERILIFVNNTPPLADAGEDQTGYPGKLLEFDGTNSSDPDRFGSIENYTWDMGDKTTLYGSIVIYKYSRYGSFKVTLTVMDNNGATNTDEAKVIITNAQPVAILKLNTPDTYLDKDIEFDASDSYDPDGQVEEYNYIFGDDTESDWIYESIVIHRYEAVGEYKITLQVKDDRSEVSEEVSIIINVIEKVNQPPVISLTYPEDDDSVAGTIKITGTAADPDKDDEIDEVEVKIDNENWIRATITNTDQESVEWEFDWDTEDISDGEHSISVRCYDGEDYSQATTISVVVNNRPTTYIELTMELKPSTTTPNNKVGVSGKANYDTKVPVTGAKVEITIEETGDKWKTQTDAQGFYSINIDAPSIPNQYTVKVYVTDDFLEREISKKLTIKLEPPDIRITEDDISFSISRPKEKQIVKITIKLHNDGGSDAEGTISFYLDKNQQSSIFERRDFNIPKQQSILIIVNWTAKKGTHLIIAEVSSVIPAETELSNNQASKKLIVTGAEEETDEKGDESIIGQINNLNPIYRYGIIVVVVVIVLLIIFAIIRSRSKTQRTEEQTGEKTSEQVIKKDMVVFRPLSEELARNAAIKTKLKGSKNNGSIKNLQGSGTKAPVKFETIGIR